MTYGGRRNHRTIVLHLLAVLGVTASLMLASSPPAGAGTHKGGPMLGVVPRQPVSGQQAPGRRPGSLKKRGKLTWHGGPVMHSSAVHAFYWVPSGFLLPAGYTTTIDNYFNDVAHDSGMNTNVYSVATQYFGPRGQFADYNVSNPVLCDPTNPSTCSTNWIINNPYPANGCPVDTADGYSVCLSDDQLRSEILTIASFFHIPAGLQDIVFLFLPKGVDTCFGNSCGHNSFCAYHSWIDQGNGTPVVLYANQPYATISSSTGTCISGQRPNSNDADDTLNVVSHEHNETITDPVGDGWFFRNGSHENGDQCAFIFGPSQGPSGAQFNQAINGHDYFIQEEWSNKPKGCRQQR